MMPSGSAVGFIGYLLPLQITTLAPSSARSRECPQQRELPPEVFGMAHKLFIGGLGFSTSTDRLREVFAEAGAVESAAVVMDRDTGQSRGFGFVEMASAEAAAEAVKKFNGKDLDGRTLKVEVANSTGAGGSRSGGGGGGGFGNRGGGGRRWERPAPENSLVHRRGRPTRIGDPSGPARSGSPHRIEQRLPRGNGAHPPREPTHRALAPPAFWEG